MKIKNQENFSFVDFLNAAIDASGMNQTNFGKAAGVGAPKMSKLVGENSDPQNIGIRNLNKLLTYILNSEKLKPLVAATFRVGNSDSLEDDGLKEYIEHLKNLVDRLELDKDGLNRDKEELRLRIKQLEAELLLLKKEYPIQDLGHFEESSAQTEESK